ncbi:MAG: helix-turn-helix transcriptional regulator [Porticoccaceae bacterium]|nr:helix-turn-helix transcriptional regulator [Porticoccaceae bacterium]
MHTDDYASLFKCLSEPVRLRILFLLLDRGELCVCDIVDTLGLSQSVVSRHLAYLRNNALLSTRREGVWIYYQIIKVSPFIDKLLALFYRSGTDSNSLQNDLKRFNACANRSCS